MEAFRIIQSYHVPEHAIFKQIKGFLTACRNTAAYCIFLPFGTSDPGSKFRRYQVFLRNHWASAPMTKGNRLWKRKRNLLRRDDYFYFHHYSFQIWITDQAWGQYDWIFGQIPFSHFVHRDQVEANEKKNDANIQLHLDWTSLVNRIYFIAKLSWFLFTTVCLAVDLIFYE